jgi:hypothetical protein
MINRRRDTKTAAVLNTDVAALNKYKQERALYQKVQSLSTEVDTMKDLLSTVTQRLEKLENK